MSVLSYASCISPFQWPVVFVGQTEDYFSEKERLVQLVRYHREVLLANQHEHFVTIATMVGLLERQQGQITFRYVVFLLCVSVRSCSLSQQKPADI